MDASGDTGGASPQAALDPLLGGAPAAGRWALDPAASRVEFHVKHFWGVITVHGSFSRVTGEGVVGADGTATGRLTIDAASLDTRNKARDKHLRSADFFDVERHPEVVVAVTSAVVAGPARLACRGTLEAAGRVRPLELMADVDGVGARAVTLRAELVVDRTEFSMTWSPLKMASHQARVTAVARFVRS